MKYLFFDNNQKANYYFYNKFIWRNRPDRYRPRTRPGDLPESTIKAIDTFLQALETIPKEKRKPRHIFQLFRQYKINIYDKRVIKRFKALKKLDVIKRLLSYLTPDTRLLKTLVKTGGREVLSNAVHNRHATAKILNIVYKRISEVTSPQDEYKFYRVDISKFIFGHPNASVALVRDIFRKYGKAHIDVLALQIKKTSNIPSDILDKAARMKIPHYPYCYTYIARHPNTTKRTCQYLYDLAFNKRYRNRASGKLPGVTGPFLDSLIIALKNRFPDLKNPT